MLVIIISLLVFFVLLAYFTSLALIISSCILFLTALIETSWWFIALKITLTSWYPANWLREQCYLLPCKDYISSKLGFSKLNVDISMNLKDQVRSNKTRICNKFNQLADSKLKY